MRGAFWIFAIVGGIYFFFAYRTTDQQNQLNQQQTEYSYNYVVDDVVDGDTIDAFDENGVPWRVRLIGIDTPERGDCGYSEATNYLSSLLTTGSRITLDPPDPGNDDQDRYGRLLRYVDMQGQDINLRMIESGYAIARYDSRDGYDYHSRQEEYIQMDNSIADYCQN